MRNYYIQKKLQQPSLMPVGATKEQQEDSIVISSIATKAIDRGYHVSGRLHTVMFGNKVGT